MKRLVDEAELLGDDEQLADLLRSAAPFETNPFRKRRILANIERQPSAGRRGFWLRPVIIGALLVSGTAAAAVGHHFVVSKAPASTPAQSSLPATSVAKRAKVALPGAREPLAAAAPSESVAVMEIAPPSATPNVKSAARPRSESSEDASHVVAAIQALRTDRDPVRAQALLDGYLKANPRGSLSGDALALSIEAASARHDPRAAEYAKKYLTLYPKGKYRDLAKRALEAR